MTTRSLRHTKRTLPARAALVAMLGIASGAAGNDFSVGGSYLDGAIGPVFSFPGCLTCTANAPSIGLVDNYLVPPPGTCVGDIDGDNITDVFDFAELASNFGRTDLIPGSGGDMDYDGDCDVLDFGVWAADFGCGT